MSSLKDGKGKYEHVEGKQKDLKNWTSRDTK